MLKRMSILAIGGVVTAENEPSRIQGFTIPNKQCHPIAAKDKRHIR